MGSWFIWLKRLLPIVVMLCAMAFLGTAIQTYAKEAPSEDAFSPVVYILLVAGCMITGLTPSMPIVILSGKVFHWFPAALYTVIGAAIAANCIPRNRKSPIRSLVLTLAVAVIYALLPL